jgi:hypothetical protein
MTNIHSIFSDIILILKSIITNNITKETIHEIRDCIHYINTYISKGTIKLINTILKTK